MVTKHNKITPANAGKALRLLFGRPWPGIAELIVGSSPMRNAGVNKKYVRFVVGKRSEDACWLTGVVTMARLKMRRFDKPSRKVVRETFRWFNTNIPCPPFSKKRKAGVWTPDAVAWFRTTACQPIARLRPLIRVLRAHGFTVRTMYADKPGKVLYRDRWQVVAETLE